MFFYFSASCYAFDIYCGTGSEPRGSRKLGKKNGKTGKLGQDRLEVRWEAVMFLFNLVI